ncbi:aspartic peptidase domain-containing protein [Lasiosphaeria hispida]|uniref:Aspartic peptidase domain-containing protein n=1 Tax=Lasiosphaeria hispida TaxID=260671 RepID=A0AAJ0H8Y9_9PEZI|nr:aspartic peptidase domain-containing protein [Lasiosphaeria hispida]
MVLLPLYLVFGLFLSLAGASPISGLSVRDGSFTVSAKRNPSYVPDGRAEYARALAKWGAEVPAELQRYVERVEGQSGSVGAMTISGDREYLTSVGIGTPPQTLALDLDTGSSDLWVYSTETNPVDLSNHTHWIPANSSTAKIVPNATWEIQYGDSSYAYGNVWRDTVTLAGITIPNSTVESALQVSWKLSSDYDMDGILGLAFGLESQVSPSQPTLLNDLLLLLESSVFTADLKWRAEGAYGFGTIDPARYNGTIQYVPLIDDAQFWQYNFTGFNVPTANPTETQTWYLSSWSAIADTGTTLLMLADDIAAIYYKSIPTALFNSSIGVYQFPCSAVLPDFKIGFDGHPGGAHAMVPGKYINYTVLEESTSTCMGGIQGNYGQPFAIFGDIFLKSVFTVFDVGNKRVGFANKTLT